MYTKIFLRLEPLGLELVAQAVRRAGHEVRLIDLQVEDHRAYFRLLEALAARDRRVFLQLPRERARDRRPGKGDEGAYPGDLCLRRRAQRASFTANAVIEHGAGAIDCVLKGEGEAAMPLLLAAIEAGKDFAAVPGAVTGRSRGPRRPALCIRSTI